MALTRVVWSWCRRARAAYWLGKSQLIYRNLLGGVGSRTRIIRPLKLECPEYIYIGERVTINDFCWLGAYPMKGSEPPRLSIGDGAAIGHYNHINCVRRVEVGSKVMTANGVHISDHDHRYEDVQVPIIEQGVVSRGPVIIGEGTWIGENANVLSCKIGKGCVIGANAVVISDIPDYSIAVGVPARVVKRYDPAKMEWLRAADAVSP